MIVMSFWEFILLNIGLLFPAGLFVFLVYFLAEPVQRLGKKIFHRKDDLKK